MGTEFSLGTVEVALSPQQRFEEFLQKEAKRLTRQRKLILDQVFSRHEHFDADELVAALQKGSGPRPSRPTVYRTLQQLVGAGLLRKMATIRGREIYEHDYGYPQHDHLHCQKCDKLIEFSSDQLKALLEAVAREHQFRVSGHRLTVEGLCPECSRPKRRNRPQDLI
jgi:Fur family ferric uptake transcriptional regulator